jgi:hypothetical protein
MENIQKPLLLSSLFYKKQEQEAAIVELSEDKNTVAVHSKHSLPISCERSVASFLLGVDGRHLGSYTSQYNRDRKAIRLAQPKQKPIS